MTYILQRVFSNGNKFNFCSNQRNNIIFGKTFDKSLYNEVISSCALETDLEILPAGDLTGKISMKIRSKKKISISN